MYNADLDLDLDQVLIHADGPFLKEVQRQGNTVYCAPIVNLTGVQDCFWSRLSKRSTLFLVFTRIALFNRYCYQKKEEKATKPPSEVTGQEVNLSIRRISAIASRISYILQESMASALIPEICS